MTEKIIEGDVGEGAEFQRRKNLLERANLTEGNSVVGLTYGPPSMRYTFLSVDNKFFPRLIFVRPEALRGFPGRTGVEAVDFDRVRFFDLFGKPIE